MLFWRSSCRRSRMMRPSSCWCQSNSSLLMMTHSAVEEVDEEFSAGFEGFCDLMEDLLVVVFGFEVRRRKRTC